MELEIEPPVCFTFAQFVQFGRDSGADLINGMPWSFTFYGQPVTHCSDTMYLIGGSEDEVVFNTGKTLEVSAECGIKLK